jgi:hypothetical protein
MPLRQHLAAFPRPILAFLVFAILIFAGAKVFPIYSNSSQLADYIRDKAVKTAADDPAPGAIQADVVHYARGLGLPLSPEEVSVTSDHGTLSIKLDYVVPVDLAVATWNLHFAPSVVSRAY